MKVSTDASGLASNLPRHYYSIIPSFTRNLKLPMGYFLHLFLHYPSSTCPDASCEGRKNP